MITPEEGVAVCGEATDSAAALKGMRRLKPDLALVDISLPNGSGLNLIRKVRTEKLPIKLLVVSIHDEALFAHRALLAGADGYIMKQEDPEEILHAIHDVLKGHTYLSEDILNAKGKPATGRRQSSDMRLDRLTDQELEILEWLGRGKNNLEIARIISATPKTVTQARMVIRQKLSLPNNQALARYAASWVENGNL